MGPLFLFFLINKRRGPLYLIYTEELGKIRDENIHPLDADLILFRLDRPRTSFLHVTDDDDVVVVVVAF